jgi:hypothetical protein
MEVVKILLAFAAMPIAVSAAGFSLTIGPPVAAGPAAKVKKTGAAIFAVRLEECDALDKAQLAGLAEGIVEGTRTTAPLIVSDAGSAGVYVVSYGGNRGEGVWVASLSATCRGAKAGAIVPLGPEGFVREKIKLLPHPATKAEIKTALNKLH